MKTYWVSPDGREAVMFDHDLDSPTEIDRTIRGFDLHEVSKQVYEQARAIASRPAVTIYTDGSCEPNPGTGGWGVFILHPASGSEKEISGAEEESTNNRMELRAVIEGLNALKSPCRVALYTDSKYVRDGVTKYIAGWKARGWRKKKGALANVDLWKELDEAIQRHSIDWNWVPGHSGIKYNERVDQLAREARERIQA